MELPVHFASSGRKWLDISFRNHLIESRRSIKWVVPPSDLTYLDFYLFGHLKTVLSQTQLQDYAGVHSRITEEYKSKKTFKIVRKSINLDEILTKMFKEYLQQIETTYNHY